MPRWSSISCLAILLASVGCSKPKEETPGPPPFTTYEIGKSAVKVTAPTAFRKTDEPGDTLVITSLREPTVKVTFNDHHVFKVAAINGESWIKSQAEKKKLDVAKKNDWLVITETVAGEDANKKKVHSQIWYAGYADRAVRVQATVYDDQKDAADVKAFFEKTVPDMIDTLKR